MHVLSLVTIATATLPHLGTNLEPLGPGGSSWPFWDVTRSSGGWVQRAGGWEMELMASSTEHPPYGKFVATWSGGAAITLVGGEDKSASDGKIEFSTTKGRVALRFEGPAPPTVAVMAPGYNPEWAGTYRPVFLQRTRLYSVIRVRSWRTMDGTGVSVSDLAELLRETNAMGWLTVEPGQTTAQTRAEAARWAQYLAPGSTVILDVSFREPEYQGHFEAFQEGLGAGRTVVRTLRLDSADAAKEVAARVDAADIDAVSLPLRFGSATVAKGGLTDPAAVLARLHSEVDSLLDGAKTAMAEVRRKKWQLLCHDAGLNLTDPEGATKAQREVLDAVARDPEMNKIYLKLLRGWRKLDGSLVCHASECAPLTSPGRAGALEWIEQDTPASPRRSALTEYALFPDS